MSDKILTKINEWREQSLHLNQLEREITNLLPDGDSGHYSPNFCEGYYATKNETRVLITHGEGWASSFIRPDVAVSVAVTLADVRKKAARAAGRASKGGGRNPKYHTEEERAAARREAVRRYRENKKQRVSGDK